MVASPRVRLALYTARAVQMLSVALQEGIAEMCHRSGLVLSREQGIQLQYDYSEHAVGLPLVHPLCVPASVAMVLSSGVGGSAGVWSYVGVLLLWQIWWLDLSIVCPHLVARSAGSFVTAPCGHGDKRSIKATVM